MKKQWLALIVTILSLFGQYWINAGKTSLKKTGEVAGREEVINYTLPPGFIFSIWSVIYLGFLIYAIAGLSKKGSKDVHMNRTVTLYTISIFLNFLWTVTVGAEFWTAAYFLQWIMLVLAIMMLFRWQPDQKNLSAYQKWMSIPFALYAGWIPVAMIPFTSDLLNRTGWNYEPFSQFTWGQIIYVAALVIVLLAFRKLKHPFYLLPLAWAYYGFIYRFDDPLQTTAIVLMGLLLLIFLVSVYRFYMMQSPAKRGE